MSDLLTNLNSIYTTKLQIKEAIGTSSDVFSDYPGYISSMILPDGTAYITENGVSDISSYQYVDVNVPSGPTPTGIKYISTNGLHDVASYAMANVSVSGGSSFEHIANFSSPTLSADSNYVFEAYNKGGNKIKQSFIDYDVTDATAQSILENYINPDSPDVDNILYNFSPGKDTYDVRCWCIYDNGSSGTAGVNDYYGNIMSVSAKFLYDWSEDFEHIYLFIIEDRSKLYEVSEGGTVSPLTINHNGTGIYVGDCKTVDVAVPSSGGSSVEYYTGEIHEDGGKDIYELTPATLPYTNVCAHSIDPNDDINIVRGTDRLWFTADGGSTYYCVGGALYVYEDTKTGEMPQSTSGIVMKLDPYPNNSDSVRLFNNSQYTLSNITTTISAIPNNANIYNVAVSFSYA